MAQKLSPKETRTNKIVDAVRSLQQADPSLISPITPYFDVSAALVPTAPGAGLLRLSAFTLSDETRWVVQNERGITYILGRDIVWQVEADEDLAKGECVYITGTSSSVPRVSKYIADGSISVAPIGVMMEAVLDTAKGLVMIQGILSMDATGLSAATELWASPTVSGGLTTTEPSHPNLKVRLGTCVQTGAVFGLVEIESLVVRGDHEGTNQTAWKIGNTANTSAILDASGISGGVKTLTLPNASGTLALVGGALAYPPGYLFGSTLRNDTDADHDIELSTGVARSESNNANLELSSVLTKRIDAAWAVGDDNGGLNTGAVGNATWYEVHLIRRSDTGVVDAMFTTTANRATLPTNYDSQRRVGWVRTDASANIMAFTQFGDYFTLTTQINDAAFQADNNAAQITLTVPPNAIARLRINGIDDASGPNATDRVTVFSEIVEGNVTPAGSTGIASLQYGETGDSGGIVYGSASHIELRVDGSSQIEHDSSNTRGVIDVSTFGWIDDRGRLY